MAMENLSTSTGPTLLPEDDIRQLALNGANLVPRDPKDDAVESIKKLQKLLDNLLFTVNHVDISGQHRTAACNLLATLVEKSAQSPIKHFRDLIWSNSTWTHTFDVYLNQHHALNVKPSRQLLTSLTSVLAKCQDQSISAPIKALTLHRLVGFLNGPSEYVPARPTMQALAHFLAKKFTSVDELSQILTEVSSSASGSKLRGLLEVVLRWAPFDDFASSSGALASAILQQSYTKDGSRPVSSFDTQNDSPWAAIVLRTLSEKPESLENFRHYIFPEIFQSDQANYIAFLGQLHVRQILGRGALSPDSLPLPRDQLEEVLFCALSVGTKLGLVRVADSTASELFFVNSILSIPDVPLGNLLLRTSATVRIAGLSMLIATTSSTQPLSLGTIRALKGGLPLLHADSDAGFRSELFSLIKNLVDRIRAATASLSKPATRTTTAKSKTKIPVEAVLDPAQLKKQLKAHQSFLEWYVSFLKMELRSTASYQRHISALKAISIIARSGVSPQVPQQYRSKSAGPIVVWPFELKVIDDDMTDLLINLLLDPFDDVRSTAAEILSLTETAPPVETSLIFPPPSKRPKLVDALLQAEEMMELSGRADQADGVAHLHSILFSQCHELIADQADWWTSRHGILDRLVYTLKETIDIAKSDISKAVNKHPLHGLFIALRYIIEKPDFYKIAASGSYAVDRLEILYDRLYRCFYDVWTCVYGTLCNDAPEGFVPDELDEEDISTKDVLSYSWRALKESSLLIRTIVKNCPLTLQDQPFMSFDRLRELGDLSFRQLAELRHRGAFSTVSQTFMVCCVRSNSGAETVSETLEAWYKHAVSCIQNQTTINTRRSAGLPALMIGIILADNKGHLFQRAMKDLTIEATKPVDQTAEKAGGLSQVHALNCIKDIFKNSKLGERSESYVPDALGLAAKCLSSDTWAVRNSGLMLFRALMDRLIGTNDAYTDEDIPTQSRLSFAAIPNLMHVVFDLLSPAASDPTQVNTEVVFPALQLLQRAQPPPEMLLQIQNAVRRLTKNSQWQIRDKAASTFSILTPPADRVQATIKVLAGDFESQNAAHGALMCSRYLIQKQQQSLTTDDFLQLLTALYQQAESLYHQSRSPLTRTAFADIQTTILQSACQNSCQLSTTDLAFDSLKEMKSVLDLPRNQVPAYSALRKALAHAILYEHAVFAGPPLDAASTIDVFHRLARTDSDACASALQQAATACTMQSRFAQSTAGLLARISTSVLFGENGVADIEVQSAAQDVILALIEAGQAHVVRNVLCHAPESLYLPPNAATPLFQDKRLVFQGMLLEFRFEGADVPNRSLSNDFQEWVLQLRTALREENPFDTRLAAANAASQINHGLTHVLNLPDYASSCLDYCVAVYDLNNDDDDDVRTIAASAACKIIARAARKDDVNEVVPLAANARLAQYIATRFVGTPLVAHLAVERLIGNSVAGSDIKSVKEILANNEKQDAALFVQEKQNLFIDETREAKIWSQVLTALDTSAFPEHLVGGLTKWVTEGLTSLTAEIQIRPDTPVGWTRKPEIFILGVQLICATDVLLGLCRKLATVPASGTEIRGKLIELLSLGRKRGVNVLWLAQIEKVVEKAILNGVGRVGTVVNAVYEEQVNA